MKYAEHQGAEGLFIKNQPRPAHHDCVAYIFRGVTRTDLSININ